LATSVVIAIPLGAYIYDRWEHKNRSHLDLPDLNAMYFRYANRSDIDEIIQLDIASFDNHEIIDLQVLSEWHKKNSPRQKNSWVVSGAGKAPSA
jgi:hypothetical protein